MDEKPQASLLRGDQIDQRMAQSPHHGAETPKVQAGRQKVRPDLANPLDEPVSCLQGGREIPAYRCEAPPPRLSGSARFTLQSPDPLDRFAEGGLELPGYLAEKHFVARQSLGESPGFPSFQQQYRLLQAARPGQAVGGPRDQVTVLAQLVVAAPGGDTGSIQLARHPLRRQVGRARGTPAAAEEKDIPQVPLNAPMIGRKGARREDLE